MAVPKRKTSPMKRGFRRSADALAAPTYVEDKESGSCAGRIIRPEVWQIRGRQVLKPKEGSDPAAFLPEMAPHGKMERHCERSESIQESRTPVVQAIPGGWPH